MHVRKLIEDENIPIYGMCCYNVLTPTVVIGWCGAVRVLSRANNYETVTLSLVLDEAC